jgi:hypothetical protein
MRISVVGAGMRQRMLFDARSIIPAYAVAAGFHYRGVGRQPRSPIAVEAR